MKMLSFRVKEKGLIQRKIPQECKSVFLGVLTMN
jgi:hypothetical protein